MLYTHEVKEWDATLGSFFFVTLSVKEALQNAALRLAERRVRRPRHQKYPDLKLIRAVHGVGRPAWLTKKV